MKKERKIVIFFGFILLIFISCFFSIKQDVEKKKDINDILKTSEYSYLPKEALNYIKDVYENTGEVILTEKNKEENVPYLNPRYVNYLTMSSEEKNDVDLIPDELILDYVPSGKMVGDGELPSSYDLRNVNGNSYLTPLKNQGSLGICWAYAIAENAETFLMVNNNQPYNSNSQKFSVRQLDYVSSFDGIIDYKNAYGEHYLGSGSNFEWELIHLASGVSLFDDSWQYNNLSSMDKLELVDVFNDFYSLYEVDSTLDMPILNINNLDFSNQNHVNIFNSYINTVKQYIKTYGGPYVATQAPNASCAAKNYYDTSKSIIDVEKTCDEDGNHAMQVIGWDDNYSYKYCLSDTRHVTWTNSCSAENTVEGTGAWILRNSWGNSVDAYTYLAYKSMYTEFDFISSLDSRSNRKWDYVYNKKIGNLSSSYSGNTTLGTYNISINNSFDIDSKLIKLKFYNNVQNNSYAVFYSESGNSNDFVLVNQANILYPGYYTVNLENKNLRMNNNSLIKIVSSDLSSDQFVVLVDELSDQVYMNTEDKTFAEEDSLLVNGHYKMHLFSNSYNIRSNSEIVYKLYDSNGNDISNSMTYENNIITNNMINTTLYLPLNTNDYPYYRVKMFYNNTEISSAKIKYMLAKPARGDGTSNNPYIITTPKELYSINYNLNAFYVLGNDIDMTYDTQNENGLFYNDGVGWIPIGKESGGTFGGNLVGSNYKIIGLKTTNGGFIDRIAGTNSRIAVNGITFEKAIFDNSSLVATVITGSLQNQVRLNNLAFVDCIFSNDGNSNNGSILATNIWSYAKNSVTINNIFSNGTIISNRAILANGITELGTDINGSSVNISNIQILDKIVNSGSSYSKFITSISGNIDISNVIINNYSTNNISLCSICNANTISFKNIYYFNTIRNLSIAKFTYSNILKMDINNIKDINNYSNWDNFSNYWVIDEVDGITRMPVLKFVDFDYTSVDDFDMSVGEIKNIADIVSPKIDAAKNYVVTTEDNNFIELNSTSGTVRALAAGTATMHVTSYYDGYDKDISFEIVSSSASISISFNANGGAGTMGYINSTAGSVITLTKNKFTRIGYTFNGWNTKSDGSGDSYSDEAEVNFNKNTILYAQWIPIKYNVNFLANGGTGDEYSQEFSYGTSGTLMANTFEKEGYRFVGWNTKSDGSGTSYNDKAVININSNVTLYAIWNAISYQVWLDPNNGIGDVIKIQLSYDEEKKLPDNTFVRDGYIFKGWNTNRSGTGESYDDGVTIINLSSVQGSVVTLYADWSEKPLIINNTNDYSGYYDEYAHSITINVNVDDYNIKYSVNNTSYNLNSLPMFSSVGEYTVNYKITKEGYDDLLGSNKVKIYGIQEIDSSIIVKNNILLVRNNSFSNISNRIITYANSTIFSHYRNNGIISTDIISTGDVINVRLNNYKDYRFSFSVLGDINSDGKISSADYVKIRKHIMQTEAIRENLYFYAADINGDGKISSADYVKVRKYIMNGESL